MRETETKTIAEERKIFVVEIPVYRKATNGQRGTSTLCFYTREKAEAFCRNLDKWQKNSVYGIPREADLSVFSRWADFNYA